MKPSNITLFQQTIVAELRRPWKKYKDYTLYYGISKTGTKRLPLTTKQGNKTFYKGTRSSGIGKHNKYGGYVIDYTKVQTFVVPENWNKELSPLIKDTVPEVKNSFSGFKGPTDPKLYLKKLNEYILHGEVETEDHVMSDRGVERG